ncbi:hypothetical protein MY10362_006630, partial [Beauveria mimosiformis]
MACIGPQGHRWLPLKSPARPPARLRRRPLNGLDLA